MSPYVAMSIYGGAMALAIVLLYSFESRAWYWHVLSLLLAFVLGYMPAPQGFDSPVMVVFTGSVIVFLLFWGLGGLLLMLAPHRHRHA